MSNELKTLRRMLETQLAQLAWNDLTRRAPVHAEILRELTEIGISQDLAEHLVRQLPEKIGSDLRAPLRDRRALAVPAGHRRPLAGRRRPRRLRRRHRRRQDHDARQARRALGAAPRRARPRAGRRRHQCASAHRTRCSRSANCWACRSTRRRTSRALPTLLSRLSASASFSSIHPGSSLRDPQLASRLAVLVQLAPRSWRPRWCWRPARRPAHSRKRCKRFAPANPCLLRAHQARRGREPRRRAVGADPGAAARFLRERRTARAGGSAPGARARAGVGAVRLAKASGAAADEDLLRRRFGKTAHAIT